MLLDDGHYRVGDNENLPHNIRFGQVIVSRGTQSDTVVQIGIGGYIGAGQHIAFRCGEIGDQVNWDDWTPLALATPPQEYALPLAEGISAGGGGKNVYWKDQFNQVHFLLSVTNQNEITSNGVLATLPVGFRPNTTSIFVGGSILNSERNGGSINVKSNGTLAYYGNTLSAGATIFGYGCFVAAS